MHVARKTVTLGVPLIVVVITICLLEYSSHRFLSSLQQIAPHHSTTKSLEIFPENEPISRSTLWCLASGRWVPLNDSQSEVTRQNAVRNILEWRRSQNISILGSTSNESCGTTTPINEDFMQYFPRLCSMSGPRPCCHDGRCVPTLPTTGSTTTCTLCTPGSTPGHCPTCPPGDRCFDARQWSGGGGPVAEGSVWQVAAREGCPDSHNTPLVPLRREQLCRLLSKVRLFIGGDSLMRNVFANLVYRVTGLDWYWGEDPKVNCTGETRYLNLRCFHNVPRAQRAMLRMAEEKVGREGPAECREALGALSWSQLTTAREAGPVVRAQWRRMAFTARRWPAIFLLGLGPHDNCEFASVRLHLLDVLRSTIQYFTSSSRRSKIVQVPRLVWSSCHTFSPVKPVPWKVSQSTERCIALTRDVMTYLTHYNMSRDLLDMLTATRHVMSHDGTHHGSQVNALKADMLLHFIRRDVLGWTE